ncbi:fibronectin type III domain-containing protein [Bacillus sp. UMB0728]|uniref:fibronectin type III domain-containing protein n=1 Tax=Bacillus sp. UMB0728 TaxID=2066052 RepID=UPI000C76550D|nr:fibronectin type III domain-containing protein [Bacillus sp. UMB0728]PLR72334.1 hypothetical protein CYJ37_12320 [Bacillus sp. UMB0728]
MNINYVLAAHGITGRDSGSKIIYESVSNLAVQTLINGTQLSVTWTNPTIPEYVKTELFVSTSDISNLDYDQTVSNATRVINGTQSSYTHNSTVGIAYYFKAYVTYTTFGETVVSRGVTSSVTAIDTTPPSPIVNMLATVNNSRVNLSWANPSDTDFLKVKILFKTGGYPTSPTDGFVGYEGSGTSASITGLTNDTQYFFRGFTYDNSLNVNGNSTQKITATPEIIKIYGVKIDKNNSNPLTAVTYTDDAVGMAPAPAGGSASGWDNVYPFNQIRPVILKDGKVVGELRKNDFSKFLNGSVADITSGNAGDVMIEFPKIWWKFETIGTDLFIKYTDKQIDSSWKCLAHTKGNEEKEKIYIGAYLGYLASSKLRSLSDKQPTTAQTIGSFRTSAQNNGNNYQQMGYFQLLMLQILYLVRYKSLDSQTSLGRGYVDGNSSAAMTGGANLREFYYGETTGNRQMKFAGIEDFWGNSHYWIDGLVTDINRNLLISSSYFNDNGSEYLNYGQASASTITGYTNEIQGGTVTGFISKSGNGTSSTYYCDNGSLKESALPIFGGNWSAASNAGAFRLRVFFSASDAYSDITARLCYV